MDKFGKEMEKPGLICQKQVKGKWETVCPWFRETPDGEPECYLGAFNYQGTEKTKTNVLRWEEKDYPRIRRCLFERADVERMLLPRYQNPVAGLQTTFQGTLTVTKKVKGGGVIEIPENEYLDAIEKPILGMRPMIGWLLIHRIKKFTPLARKKGRGVVKAPFPLPGGWTRIKLWRLVTEKEIDPETIAKHILRDQTKQTSLAVPINKKEMARRMQIWTDWGVMVRRHVLKRVQEGAEIVTTLTRSKKKKIAKLLKQVEKKFRGYLYNPSVLKTYFMQYSEIMDTKKWIDKASTGVKYEGYHSVIKEIAVMNSQALHASKKAFSAYHFIERTARKKGQTVPTISELLKIEAEKKKYVALYRKWRAKTYSNLTKTFKISDKGGVVWAGKYSDMEQIIILDVYNEKLEHKRERARVAYNLAIPEFEKKYGFPPLVIRDVGEIKQLAKVEGSDLTIAYKQYMEAMTTSQIFDTWTAIQISPQNFSKDYKEYIKQRVLAILGDTKAQVKSDKLLHIEYLNQQLKAWGTKRQQVSDEIDGLTKNAEVIRRKIREGKKKLQKVQVVQDLIMEKKQKQFGIKEKRVRLRKLLKKMKTKAGKKKLQRKIAESMKLHKLIQKKIDKLQEQLKNIPSINHLVEELERIEKGYSAWAREKKPGLYTGATPPPAPAEGRYTPSSSAGVLQLREYLKLIDEEKIPALKKQIKDEMAGYERINTVITVPHAAPTAPKEEHLTDWAAPELATKLSNLLKG